MNAFSFSVLVRWAFSTASVHLGIKSLDIPSVGGIMMLVESTVYNASPKSPTGLHLSWDLVSVTETTYDLPFTVSSSLSYSLSKLTNYSYSIMLQWSTLSLKTGTKSKLFCFASVRVRNGWFSCFFLVIGPTVLVHLAKVNKNRKVGQEICLSLVAGVLPVIFCPCLYIWCIQFMRHPTPHQWCLLRCSGRSPRLLEFLWVQHVRLHQSGCTLHIK